LSAVHCGTAGGGIIIAGNFYETAAIMGLYPHAVDLTELTSGRRSEAETPWFGKHKYADGADINAGLSAKDATEEFGATRAHALFLRVAFSLSRACLDKITMYSRDWFKNLPLSAGTALVDAWAASLAAEVLERSGLPLPDGTPHAKRQNSEMERQMQRKGGRTEIAI
jgi:hypothetical protein